MKKQNKIRTNNNSSLKLEGKTILVVDDDPIFCDLAKVSLEKSGAKVICAHNGLAAVGILKHTRIDAATIDLIMPEMDGLRLMANIRHMSEVRHIPLVVVTSRHDQQAKRDAARFDISSYQVKPLNWADLIACLVFSLRQSNKKSPPKSGKAAA